ncbi:hypothetical protein DIPPA_15939 [Diplonema papillatum]|nr:hypothetical protein DIPPA_15939 [Diplonema papillatum]
MTELAQQNRERDQLEESAKLSRILRRNDTDSDCDDELVRACNGLFEATVTDAESFAGSRRSSGASRGGPTESGDPSDDESENQHARVLDNRGPPASRFGNAAQGAALFAPAPSSFDKPPYPTRFGGAEPDAPFPARARSCFLAAGSEDEGTSLELLHRRVGSIEDKVDALRGEVRALCRFFSSCSQSMSTHTPRPMMSECMPPLPPLPAQVKSNFGAGNERRASSSGSRSSLLFPVPPSCRGSFRQCMEPVSLLHMVFDLDGDGYLNYADCAKLQEVTEGAVLTKAEYILECKRLKVNPDVGLDVSDLEKMYRQDGSELDRDVRLATTYIETTFCRAGTPRS